MDLVLPGLFTKCTANGAEVWLSFKPFCQFCERFLERLEGDQICTREHCPDTLSKLSHVGTHVQHCLDAAVCEPMILGLVLRAKSRNHFFQKIRRHRVIAPSDIHILATRQLDAVIKAGVNAFPWSLRNSHARFTRRQFLDILPRTIIRITVTNNQLPVLKGLVENRLKPLRQIRPRVQSRNTNRNFRHLNLLQASNPRSTPRSRPHFSRSSRSFTSAVM